MPAYLYQEWNISRYDLKDRLIPAFDFLVWVLEPSITYTASQLRQMQNLFQ